MGNKKSYIDLCRSFAVHGNKNLWYLDEDTNRPFALQFGDGLYKRCLVLEEEEYLSRIIDCYVNFEKSKLIEPSDHYYDPMTTEIEDVDLKNIEVIYQITSTRDEKMIKKAVRKGENLFKKFCDKYEKKMIREIELFLFELIKSKYIIKTDRGNYSPVIHDGMVIYYPDIVGGLLRGKLRFIPKIVKHLNLTYPNIPPEELNNIQEKISKNNHEFKKEVEAFLKEVRRKYFSLFDDFLGEKLNKEKKGEA